jgi:hypothetical protein
MPEKKLAELCRTCEETGSEYIQMLKEIKKNYHDRGKKHPKCYETAVDFLLKRARGNHDLVWEWIYRNVEKGSLAESAVHNPELLIQFLTDCSHCKIYQKIGRSGSQKIYQNCPNM